MGTTSSSSNLSAKSLDIVMSDAMKDDVEFLEIASNKAREMKKIPVVLVGSGAFCPVHRGHLLMMRAAAKALPTKRHVVVGAVLIPACDDYIARKLVHEPEAFRLPFHLRSQLIRATANDLNFEYKNGNFPIHICDAEQTDRDFGTGVIGHLRMLYNLKRGSKSPSCPALVWVNGDDKPYMLFSAPRTNERGCDGVVVVSRQKKMLPTLVRAKADGLCKGLTQIGECEPESNGVSSSKLREAVETALAAHGTDTDTDCVNAVCMAAAPFMSQSAAAIYAKNVVEEMI